MVASASGAVDGMPGDGRRPPWHGAQSKTTAGDRSAAALACSLNSVQLHAALYVNLSSVPLFVAAKAASVPGLLEAVTSHLLLDAVVRCRCTHTLKLSFIRHFV